MDRGYRHAWDHFPPGDDLGCLAAITPEVRAHAMTEAREGVVTNVTLPLTLPDPPLFGRQQMQHAVFSTNRNNLDDRLDGFYPQGSTQWDGFRHIRAREYGFFTGVRVEDRFPDGDDRLGIGHWAQQGIIGRGVLLDFADRFTDNGFAADEENAITAQDLQQKAETIGLRSGDILCIRTGWMTRYLGSDRAERERIAREQAWPGLSAGADVAEFLWDTGVAAVAVDNPSVENAPGSRELGSLHRRLLPLLGMPMGELFAFDDLALQCAQRGRWAFLFVSIPWNLPAGAGSPGNAVAIH